MPRTVAIAAVLAVQVVAVLALGRWVSPTAAAALAIAWMGAWVLADVLLRRRTGMGVDGR